MSDQPIVTIIVPTKNSESTIGNCLRSIRQQTYKNIEIIVVDNYSCDRTKKIAEEYVNVLCKGPERSSQRNFGAQSAVGNYLFFVDSDMELTPKVVEDCVKVTNGNHIDAVIIPEISIGDGFWANCKALERSCYVGDDTIEAARFFSKSVFFSIGCFDEQITGQEDWDLQARIGKAGYKTGRVCSFIVHNEEHMSLRKTMIKKRNYGKTLKMYTRKHPKATAAQLTLIRPAFIRNWRKLSKDPLHTSGMLFMKICEITASWIGLW